MNQQQAEQAFKDLVDSFKLNKEDKWASEIFISTLIFLIFIFVSVEVFEGTDTLKPVATAGTIGFAASWIYICYRQYKREQKEIEES